MSIRSEAEEHLRIIRGLMERATLYRAISAPAALLGGLLAVAVGIAGFWLSHPPFEVPNAAFRFALPWGCVLFVASGANFWLLRRDALRRDEPFFSPGMRLALRAMLPALLGGGLCTVLESSGGWALIASLWVLFYGISLLAASHFAPKSICWLGRAFFTAGAALLLVGGPFFHWWEGGRQESAAHLIMALTFGVFHLIYAACTWPRKSSDTTAAVAP